MTLGCFEINLHIMFKLTETLSIDPNDYFFSCRTLYKILCQCAELFNITCVIPVPFVFYIHYNDYYNVTGTEVSLLYDAVSCY